MESELSMELRGYLEHCGLSKSKIAQCSRSTRMYHDLGLYGDIAEACMEVLAERYQVDLRGFEFDKYFPPEFPGKNMLTGFLFQIIPFAGHMARRRWVYLPLTLGMIERSIRSGRWE